MTDLANYYDESYPPSILGLSSTHDLRLVGTVDPPGGLTVVFTWDSNGKAATITFGDGQSANIAAGVQTTTHTYATGDEYTVTVTSPNATDSADIDLGGGVGDPEPEPDAEVPDPYDPAEETIAEVEAYVEAYGVISDPAVQAFVQHVLDLERAGKNRSTLVAWLDARLGVV